MSKRQKDIVEFIRTYTTTYGFAPTIREIGKGVGLHSSSTVMGYLYRMRDAGVVTWKDSSSRTIRVFG